MIVVSGTFEIDPADRERALPVLLRMAAASRAEPDCLAYDFWADLENPARFRVFEEWRSAEALEAHFGTAHMAEFRQAIGGLRGLARDITRYEIGGTSQL